MRRTRLTAGFFVLATVLLTALACSKPAGVKAVVLITMESVGAGDTSAGHGVWSTTDTTPPEGGTSFAPPLPEDLDDIATVGTRFANAMAPSTSALASLAELHTGRPPEEVGVYSDLDTLRDAPTLAEILAIANVRSGAFVARESLTAAAGLARGFDSYATFPRRAPAAAAGLVEEAKVWLDAARISSPGRPLFLWVHLSSPRPPFEPPPELAARFVPDVDMALGSLDRLAAMAAGVNGWEALRPSVAALHAASILHDAATARRLLLAIRPSLDDFKNTTLVFAGTNGELAGEWGLTGSRRLLRDATLHVPLFLWTRGVRGMPRVAAPVVELRDLTATIAGLLGAPVPEGSRGRNLLTAARDPAAREHAAFATFENRIFTVRTIRERFVCNPRGVKITSWPGGAFQQAREEYFDLDVDPRETGNAIEGNAARARQLRLLLERERAMVKPIPPRSETDAERLKLLTDEGIHGGEGHFADGAPVSGCGSER